MAILRQTERAMIRAMCSVKLMDKKNTEESIVMLGLKETIDTVSWQKQMVVRWYVHLLRREEDDGIVLQGGRPEKEGTAEEDLEKLSRR